MVSILGVTRGDPSDILLQRRDAGPSDQTAKLKLLFEPDSDSVPQV